MRCPGCSRPLLFHTIASGNNFGGNRWSDGKVVNPMLPDEPWLRASPAEDVIFWADECEQIGVRDGALHPEWEGAQFAVEPSEAQYIRAIQQGMASQPIKEFYLRQRLWWSGNDRRRYGQLSHPLEDVHRENLTALEKLFGANQGHGALIARAEILRELSLFEASTALLRDIPFDEQLGPIADRIYDEAERRNPVVFEIASDRGRGKEPRARSSRLSAGKAPPQDTPGVPRSPEDRRLYYSQPAVVERALHLAETVGFGTIDGAVIARNLKAGSKVLDAGCGVGRVALGLWQNGVRQIDACDFASAQVTAARIFLAQHNAEVSVADWDFTSLPVPDGNYDAVVCLGNTLGELFSRDERAAAVKEFARVVRPGGQFFFSLPCGALQSELDCIMGSPRFVPTPEWTGGMVNRDVRYGTLTAAEAEAFGARCYHISERIGSH
jgi:SAM-dependent methyltransferase